MPKDACIQVGIPKSWLKKLIPYIITILISGGSYAGIEQLSNSPTDYSHQIEALQNDYTKLNNKIISVESVQSTILVQLSDIKEQTKDNADISNKILLLLSSKNK